MCMLPVLGPRYLTSEDKTFILWYAVLCRVYIHVDVNTTCEYVAVGQKVKRVLHREYILEDYLCFYIWSFLPFFVFEVLERQVYDFLDESIQKWMERDLYLKEKKCCIIIILFRFPSFNLMNLNI